jgi:hypothetical protein
MQLEVPKQVIKGDPGVLAPKAQVPKQAPITMLRSPTRRVASPETSSPGAYTTTLSTRASGEAVGARDWRQGERLKLFSFQRPTQKTPLATVKQKNTSDFLSDWNF